MIFFFYFFNEIEGEFGLGKFIFINSLFLIDFYIDRKLFKVVGEVYLS